MGWEDYKMVKKNCVLIYKKGWGIFLRFVRNFQEVLDDTVHEYGKPNKIYQYNCFPCVILEYDDFKIRLGVRWGGLIKNEWW